MHEEKQLSIEYYLGTVPNHGLKFLLEDRKTLGQLTLNPCFQFRGKARIQPLKHCLEPAATTLYLLLFKPYLSTSQVRMSSVQQHWVLVVGISSSISRFFTPGRGDH